MNLQLDRQRLHQDMHGMTEVLQPPSLKVQQHHNIHSRIWCLSHLKYGKHKPRAECSPGIDGLACFHSVLMLSQYLSDFEDYQQSSDRTRNVIKQQTTYIFAIDYRESCCSYFEDKQDGKQTSILKCQVWLDFLRRSTYSIEHAFVLSNSTNTTQEASHEHEQSRCQHKGWYCQGQSGTKGICIDKQNDAQCCADDTRALQMGNCKNKKHEILLPTVSLKTKLSVHLRRRRY